MALAGQSRILARAIGHGRASSRRWQSSFADLEPEMTARKIRPIFDDLSPQSSFRLDTSLADYLPDGKSPRILPSTASPLPLPIPHHLVYFEPTKPQSDLLPDGTNPDQSPGEPFVRRMWAGGTVLYNIARPLLMDGSRGVCVEGIRDVTVKGKPGDEKIFVGIERRLAGVTALESVALAECRDDADAIAAVEERIRARLWQDDDKAFGPCSVVERRNIVFLRERTPQQLKLAAEAATKPEKKLVPQHRPDLFSHTVVPNEKLLFRFSALTFNAHAIHLDPEYCRTIEGHRNLLFHGPMSFTFMVVLLQQALAKEGRGERINFVEYRNLAPLYAHEPIKFCGTRLKDGEYEIWTETPDGGVAVKGKVRTVVL